MTRRLNHFLISQTISFKSIRLINLTVLGILFLCKLILLILHFILLIRVKQSIQKRLLPLILLLGNGCDGRHIYSLLLARELQLCILQLPLLLLDEHFDVVVGQIQLELFADIVDEHAHNVPVTQIFYVFFQNISFQALKSKSYLLMEDLRLKMIV